MRNAFRAAAMAVIVMTAASSFGSPGVAANILNNLFPDPFWQGAWGTPGATQIITVSGARVTYAGIDGQSYPVSKVNISGSQITFTVGSGAVVTLTKRPDKAVQMVSTVGSHQSDPIVLCKSNAAHCP